MKAPLVILLVFFATAAFAGECKQQAVLHDAEYYMSEFRLSEGKVASFRISVWDSPSMIRVLARLVPGTTVSVAGKSGNFYKVKIKTSDGKYVYGWISDLQIERLMAKEDDSEVCDY